MTLENEFNTNMNSNKFQIIMIKHNIICPIHKTNPYKPIGKVTQEHSIVPNIANIKFNQSIPGKVLLTYMPYSNNKMIYLSTVKDSSTNEITILLSI
ncbi:MAG: hypothetical protein RR942_09505 [Romboutsia sp.]